MRIEIHDRRRRTRVRVYVDPARPPARVPLAGRAGSADPAGPALVLDWNQTLDDAGRLRRCPVCGGDRLYRRRAVPRLTLFAVVLATGVAVLLLTYGPALSRPVVAGLILLLAADLAIWHFVPEEVGCYRCRARFSGTPVPRQLKTWSADAVPEAPAVRGGPPPAAAAAPGAFS